MTDNNRTWIDEASNVSPRMVRRLLLSKARIQRHAERRLAVLAMAPTERRMRSWRRAL